MDNLIKMIQLDTLELKNVFYCLCIFIGIDIFTGLIKAIVEKKLNSTIMKKGLYGKVGEMTIVALTLVLCWFLNLPTTIVLITCLFYIAQEGLSILENTGSYISYPKQIKDVLENLKTYTTKGEK